eukprot:463824-Pelagomonas_calceolata.AAC.1
MSCSRVLPRGVASILQCRAAQSQHSKRARGLLPCQVAFRNVCRWLRLYWYWYNMALPDNKA